MAPFTVVNLAIGASGIRFVDFAVGTLIGMGPGLVLLSFVGDRIVEICRIPAAAIAVVVLARRGVIAVALRAQALVARRGGRHVRRRGETVARHDLEHQWSAGPQPALRPGARRGLRAAPSPDIVALQEVDSRRARDAGIANPFDVLREALGSPRLGAHAISTADGDYGQALISRWPLA